MPTSVLLAVLVTAGLLAFAPALVRRYDATERLVAERALSTARVLTRAGAQRHRRRRTVPGARPVNPPGWLLPRAAPGSRSPLGFAASAEVPAGAAMTAAPPGAAPSPGVASPAVAASPGGASLSPGAASSYGAPAGSGSAPPAGPGSAPPDARRLAARRRHERASRAVYRRRRVLLALVLLNVVELVGAVFVEPGFWIGTAVTGTLLVTYLVHLRNRALADARRRREDARYAAWVAARQAAVRREQARRAAARREAVLAQLAERDQARRDAARIAALRGRPYAWRAVGE
ncbi:MAG TPA: hypothetical protein VK453_00655 [Micromonosporaceae bacterium]|nr:hypothetical protein [Micromonosporaceae bacterium]